MCLQGQPVPCIEEKKERKTAVISKVVENWGWSLCLLGVWLVVPVNPEDEGLLSLIQCSSCPATHNLRGYSSATSLKTFSFCVFIIYLAACFACVSILLMSIVRPPHVAHRSSSCREHNLRMCSRVWRPSPQGQSGVSTAPYVCRRPFSAILVCSCVTTELTAFCTPAWKPMTEWCGVGACLWSSRSEPPTHFSQLASQFPLISFLIRCLAAESKHCWLPWVPCCDASLASRSATSLPRTFLCAAIQRMVTGILFSLSFASLLTILLRMYCPDCPCGSAVDIMAAWLSVQMVSAGGLVSIAIWHAMSIPSSSPE